MHPLQRLIQTADQVLAAAVVAVGARPHVEARLGGDNQLVAMGVPVAIHVHAEIALGLAVGRSVVVGPIEVGDSAVKGRAQQALLHAEERDIAEIVPQPQ